MAKVWIGTRGGSPVAFNIDVQGEEEVKKWLDEQFSEKRWRLAFLRHIGTTFIPSIKRYAPSRVTNKVRQVGIGIGVPFTIKDYPYVYWGIRKAIYKFIRKAGKEISRNERF